MQTRQTVFASVSRHGWKFELTSIEGEGDVEGATIIEGLGVSVACTGYYHLHGPRISWVGIRDQ